MLDLKPTMWTVMLLELCLEAKSPPNQESEKSLSIITSTVRTAQKRNLMHSKHSIDSIEMLESWLIYFYIIQWFS